MEWVPWQRMAVFFKAPLEWCFPGQGFRGLCFGLFPQGKVSDRVITCLPSRFGSSNVSDLIHVDIIEFM